jgi:cytosine/adenosine deaminase-related metal-dependent hydrolase
MISRKKKCREVENSTFGSISINFERRVRAMQRKRERERERGKEGREMKMISCGFINAHTHTQYPQQQHPIISLFKLQPHFLFLL